MQIYQVLWVGEGLITGSNMVFRNTQLAQNLIDTTPTGEQAAHSIHVWTIFNDWKIIKCAPRTWPEAAAAGASRWDVNSLIWIRGALSLRTFVCWVCELTAADKFDGVEYSSH